MDYDPAAQSHARRRLWQLFEAHPSLKKKVKLDDLNAQRADATGRYQRTDWTAMLREMEAVVREAAEHAPPPEDVR